MVVFIDFDKKKADIKMKIIAENAILNPVEILDHIPAICALKRLLTIIMLMSDVSRMLITKTIAWVSDNLNGTNALIRSFLVCESRKNGIITIARIIL